MFTKKSEIILVWKGFKKETQETKNEYKQHRKVLKKRKKPIQRNEKFEKKIPVKHDMLQP